MLSTTAARPSEPARAHSGQAPGSATAVVGAGAVLWVTAATVTAAGSSALPVGPGRGMLDPWGNGG